MKPYRDLVMKCLTTGIPLNKNNERTGTGTISLYGEQMKFDTHPRFPLVTLKRTFFKGVVEELLWFLRGETNIRSLQAAGVHIWDEWADNNGELGPVYGKMWRDWNGLDQLQQLVENIKTNPHSRRHIVSAWNPALLPDENESHAINVKNGKQALPPCHTLWQVMIDGERRLHLHLYQRSADLFLGVPFNIASYYLLMMLLAHHTHCHVGEFTWSGGDCHLYQNHIPQTEEMLNRKCLPLPMVILHHAPETPLDQIKATDIELIHYQAHAAIKAPVAV